MLLGNFFDIQSFTNTETSEDQQKYKVSTKLNQNHAIYQGHFPGNPIVPGVCQVQMVRELAEKALNTSLRLTESDNIKFLSMIIPHENPLLDVDLVIKPLSENRYSITATLGKSESIFLKFKGKFEKAV
ncbi:MAG: 3-hydroxylacyl-ACP dehydratase [Bacteroidales bacterium]|nr:3-hydroxylacyl-ACP dehydratase [Bacteroidales bacterium]MDD4603275.1 3-hydroxylacyl-ACP dehydratase [Bacteroidales bacterium]